MKYLLVGALLACASAACTTHNGGGSGDAGTTSSGSSGSSGNGGGTGGSTGGTGGTSSSSCAALPAGTYVIEYTLVSGSGCNQLSTTTFTVNASGQTSLTTGPGCITHNDPIACTTQTTCTTTTSGYTDESDSNATISGSSGSGTLRVTESQGGSLVYDCAYTFTISKQ